MFFKITDFHRKETADRIANDVDGACARLIELAKVNDDTFMVLNHGDCWICNIMFKYSPLDESLPIAMRYLYISCFDLLKCSLYF